MGGQARMKSSRFRRSSQVFHFVPNAELFFIPFRALKYHLQFNRKRILPGSCVAPRRVSRIPELFAGGGEIRLRIAAQATRDVTGRFAEGVICDAKRVRSPHLHAAWPILRGVFEARPSRLSREPNSSLCGSVRVIPAERHLQTLPSDWPCTSSGSVRQRRERWTNKGDSMNTKVKVNERARDKGCTHAISGR